MNRRAQTLLSLFAMTATLGCEPSAKPTSSSSPATTTPAVEATAQGAAQAPTAPSPASDNTECQPMTDAKPMHEELACLAEGIPYDRPVVISSRASIKGFVGEAERKTGTSCPMPPLNFNTHHLVAYHARGPCKIRVEDTLCAGPSPRYKVDIFSNSGCTHYGTSPRFWIIPALKDTERLEIELKRKSEETP